MTIKKILVSLVVVALGSAAVLGCKPRQETSEALASGSPLSEGSQRWLQRRNAVLANIQQMTQNNEDYDYFLEYPLGKSGAWGIPFILFRLLPEIDQELFPAPSQGDAMSKFRAAMRPFGFHFDERRKDRPVPQGFTWSGFLQKDSSKNEMDMTMRTCGGCHTGRVRITQQDYQRSLLAPKLWPAFNSTLMLQAGAHTTLDVSKFLAVFTAFAKRHLTPARRAATLKKIFALIDSHKSDPNYFYRDYRYKNFKFDGAYEANQIKAFKATMKDPKVLDQIIATTERRVALFEKLNAHAYSKKPGRPLPPDTTGKSAGMIDSAGGGLAAFLPQQLMFDRPTINDVPAVWNQRTHGAFQWDGNISTVFYRNFTAALAILPVLPDEDGKPKVQIDVPASVKVASFINTVPAAPYPFALNYEKAQRGWEIYKKQCYDCHQPGNRRVYKELGTDMNRALAVSRPGAYETFLKAFEIGVRGPLCSTIPKNSTFTYRTGRKSQPLAQAQPCLEPAGTIFPDRSKPQTQGYLASNLDGVWSTAPYLHNGSVPTLRHLLNKKLREETKQFVRGSLIYDQVNLGYEWRPKNINRAMEPTTFLYDASRDGLSNEGHDQPELKVRTSSGARTYKLDYSDDPEELEALLEYMKTIGTGLFNEPNTLN